MITTIESLNAFREKALVEEARHSALKLEYQDLILTSNESISKTLLKNEGFVNQLIILENENATGRRNFAREFRSTFRCSENQRMLTENKLEEIQARYEAKDRDLTDLKEFDVRSKVT